MNLVSFVSSHLYQDEAFACDVMTTMFVYQRHGGPGGHLDDISRDACLNPEFHYKDHNNGAKA